MPTQQMQTQRAQAIDFRTAGEGDRVALRGVRVHALLAGMAQRTSVEQTFVNLEDRAIEAVYTFPLPESAAVCGFEVITADRVLTGTVEENDAAEERYEKAISEGHGAFMVEQHRPDVFSVRVGNIKPRQVATIRLTYVAPLKYVDRHVRVAFPTTVAPRYVTQSGSDDAVATAVDGDAINPPHVPVTPYGLSLTVDVDLGRAAVTGVVCPSHPVNAEDRGEGRWRVTLAGGPTPMDRDVVLQLMLAKEAQAGVQAGKGPARSPHAGETFLAVTFVPHFSEAELESPAACETIFVLDCSGSMQGESIRQAVAALSLCLRQLNAGDAFNVVRFGSTFEMMAERPVAYDQRSMEAALAYVDRGADLGGTELLGPLQTILASPVTVGRVRQVILLTDGQVSNEAAIVELARKHRRTTRVFTFGIGAACSASLVEGLARATGGAAEFVSAGERIDDKVLRTFARLASPPVTDVRIDWGGAEVQTLAGLPPLFDGDALTVFARCLGRPPEKVTLSCEAPSGRRAWALAVPPAVEDEGLVATMWARRAIQSIEEVNALSSLSAPARKASKEAQTVIALAKAFNLASTLTSFISVEHRTLAERNEGAPELRRVPVTLAHGWGGDSEEEAGRMLFCRQPATAAPARAYFMAPPSPSPSPGAAPAAPPPPAAAAGGGLGGMAKRILSRARKSRVHISYDAAAAPDVLAERSAGVPAQPPQPDDAMLLSAQRADGSFEFSPPHAEVLGKLAPRGTRGKVVDAVEAWAKEKGVTATERAIDTATALVLLRRHFADREDLWKRAWKKAVAYLAGALRRTADEVEALVIDLASKA